MLVCNGVVTPGPSRECDIIFFVEGRPKSARQSRDIAVAVHRVQSVTVPSSRVSRKVPPFKNARLKRHLFPYGGRVKTKSHGIWDLFVDAAPHPEYFFQCVELNTKAAFAKLACDTPNFLTQGKELQRPFGPQTFRGGLCWLRRQRSGEVWGPRALCVLPVFWGLCQDASAIWHVSQNSSHLSFCLAI